MAKARRNVGREILGGLRELKRGGYGRVINVPDVALVREKTGLSQSRFAALLGVSVRTLQDWEQAGVHAAAVRALVPALRRRDVGLGGARAWGRRRGVTIGVNRVGDKNFINWI